MLSAARVQIPPSPPKLAEFELKSSFSASFLFVLFNYLSFINCAEVEEELMKFDI